MKSNRPWILITGSVLAVVALYFLIPLFGITQPVGLSVTRSQAREIADRTARDLGIEVDDSWVMQLWTGASHLDKELNGDPDLRRRANQDEVVGPRLGEYRVVYYRKNLPKFPEYGWVSVGRNGQVVGARRMPLREEAAAQADPEALRAQADEFVFSSHLPGAPAPVFESMRPTVQRNRTDYQFRYSVDSEIDAGDLRFFVGIYFTGERLAGWTLFEERADGSALNVDLGGALAGFFLQIAALFSVLLILLVLFLRKYHAGEVGVGVGALLFAFLVLLSLVGEAGLGAESSFYNGIGSVAAQPTAWANSGFKFFFFHLPMAVLAFLAWTVGESFARERWGHRLASFDALLRRDLFNATVGKSVLSGLLAAPIASALSVAVAAIPLVLGWAQPSASLLPLTHGYSAASAAVLLRALGDGVLLPVVCLLFVLSALRSRIWNWAALIAAVALGIFITQPLAQALEPEFWGLLFGFGLPLAAVAVFLVYDLLAASVTVFAATLILNLVPFLLTIDSSIIMGPAMTLCLPLLFLLGVGIAGATTRREVQYTYDDLAVHVRRIVERERVKAEIDAANRIQAALLPSEDPSFHNVKVSSYYGAATEIGGDYFDFLDVGEGKVGIAFGDVAGHGLTSGIVMAMAKSALLVQIGYDSSPTRVMEVLNEIVQKTAPSRMMMTFFFGVLDPHTRRLRFSSAGHLDPYVYRATTGKLECLSAWGYPLGLVRRDPFRELIVQFQPGDRLVLYSDGLIEALDDHDEIYGFERFEAALSKVASRSTEEIRQALLSSVRSFTQNRPPEDDQTLVVIGFEEPAAVARSA